MGRRSLGEIGVLGEESKESRVHHTSWVTKAKFEDTQIKMLFMPGGGGKTVIVLISFLFLH